MVVTDLANARFAGLARACGHTPILTRPLGFVELADRGKLAVAMRADLFLSFHVNAATSLARGFQVWHHGGDQRSRAIALRLSGTVVGGLPMWAGNAWRVAADTERYHTGFAVLRDTYQHMPALLLEVGFISSEADADLLRDPVLKQATCLLILSALTASLTHDEI